MSRLLFLSLLLCGPLFAAQVAEDPLDRQVHDIAKDLRCAVCQNQPVSESNSDLARDMRDLIRDQLKAGKPRDEIVQYFVARYGDYVLMKPPYQGPGFLLWLMPGGFAVLLAVSAAIYLRRRRREPMPPTPELSSEDRARIEAARQREGA
jgi:cytochrome c-type biogenesis protein CcmH